MRSPYTVDRLICALFLHTTLCFNSTGSTIRNGQARHRQRQTRIGIFPATATISLELIQQLLPAKKLPYFGGSIAYKIVRIELPSAIVSVVVCRKGQLQDIAWRRVRVFNISYLFT